MKILRSRFLLIAALMSLLPLSALPATYQITPGSDIVGEIFVTRAHSGEDLSDVGRRFGISMHEMMEANPGIKPYSRIGGREVVVPAQFILPPYRKGVVINLAELRLYYFTPDGRVITYPVGLGRDQWRTPTTSTRVVRKATDPVWNPPESIRQFVYEQTGRILPDSMPPGPENPLGPYAMYLGTAGYLVHGTNQPESIGKFVSSGCIRMYNEDVQDIYYRVGVGTPVRIIHHPYKAGWANGKLYLESQQPLELDEMPSALNQVSWESVVNQKIGNKSAVVDWRRGAQVARQHLGIPQVIGHKPWVQAANQE